MEFSPSLREMKKGEKVETFSILISELLNARILCYISRRKSMQRSQGSIFTYHQHFDHSMFSFVLFSTSIEVFKKSKNSSSQSYSIGVRLTRRVRYVCEVIGKKSKSLDGYKEWKQVTAFS